MITLLRNCLFLLLCYALSACSNNPSGSASLQSSLVNMVDAGLLASASGKPELGLTLRNASSVPLWVLVHFKTPDGIGDCVLAQEMNAADEHFFACAQENVQADTNYQISIEIRRRAAQRNPTEALNTDMSFSAADIANAGG